MSRKIDDLVAKHITNHVQYETREVDVNREPWLIRDMEDWKESHRDDYEGLVISYQYRKKEDIPNYSTDITAAWKVVEEIRKIGELFTVQDSNFMDRKDRTMYTAGFQMFIDGDIYWDNRLGSPVSATTAPMAICLAALKLKGVKIDE